MKKITTYAISAAAGTAIRMTVALVVSLLFFTGCASDVDLPDGGGTDTSVTDGSVYRAGFSLVVAQSQGTRAPSEGYNPGVIDENYVDFASGDYRVLFFNKENVYVGTITDIHFRVTDTSLFKTYYVDGLIDKGMIDSNGRALKVMIVANWKRGWGREYPVMTPSVSTVKDVADASLRGFTATKEGDLLVDENRHIPMFGITDIQEDIAFDGNNYHDLGTIHLLRAFSKVEVIFDELNGFEVESVSMTRVNTSMFMAPEDVDSESDYVKGSYAEDYTPVPSIPAGSGVAQNVRFEEVGEPGSGHYVMFVPEFANLVGGDRSQVKGEEERARIEVKFKSSRYEKQYLDFMYYGEPPSYALGGTNPPKKGDHFDVMRNNWYRFTVTKNPENLTIEVDVVPYSCIELKVDYGFHRDPESGYLVTEKYLAQTGHRFYYDDHNTGHYFIKEGNEFVWIPKRFERKADEHRTFVVRRPRSREVLYMFDPVTGRYYTDFKCTQELTSPLDIKNYFTVIEDEKTKAKKTVLKVDSKGTVEFYYDHTDGTFRDINRLTVSENNQNWGLRWLGVTSYSDYIVTECEDRNVAEFAVDRKTDIYYRWENNGSATEMKLTYPPVPIPDVTE